MTCHIAGRSQALEYFMQIQAVKEQSAAAVRVQVITELASLQALQVEWSELLARSASPEPMLSPTWLLTWWQVYGQNRALCVVLFYLQDRLVGLAPLQRRRFWHKPGIPFTRLEPLGADVDEDDGVCSDYLNVIAEIDHEEAVAKGLAEALAARSMGRWTEFVLPAMDGESRMVPLLSQCLRGKGFDVECQASGVAPFIALPETWEEYLQALPSKKRYPITRALREFDKWAGDDWQLHEARTSAELVEGNRILQSLHSERWQGKGQAGAFGGQRFRDFHDAIMPRLLTEGRLELMWLAVRGDPIAAVYHLIDNNKVYFYQCGRKMDLPHGQRPGLVILAKAIQKAITAGRREFDFLAGAAQYKSQFAPLARPIVQIRAVPFSLRERFRRLVRHGVALARNLRAAAASKARTEKKADDLS